MKNISEATKLHPITQLALSEYVRRVAEYEKENLLKIVLFGSVARDEATDDSDVDVLVLLKENNLNHRMGIAGITVDVKGNLNFNDRSDIMTVLMSEKNSLNSGLMRNIDKEGVMLYEYS